MKKCFKCNKHKPLNEFYRHPEMRDGHLNKCKSCTRIDNKISNGTQERQCVICEAEFRTTLTEIKRGGGNCCSRDCWYKHFNNIVKRDEESPNWKGDEVGLEALHGWVIRKLGKPNKCEHCGSTNSLKYDWANKSGKYKRNLEDWLRLCRSCHTKYDKVERVRKWRETVKSRHGWNVIEN